MSDQPTPRKITPGRTEPQAKPASYILREDQLTPFELQIVKEKFGYAGGEIPSNLAELMPTAEAELALQQAAQQAANVGVAGFALPTQGLDMASVRTVHDPEKVEAMYTQALARMNANMAATPTPEAVATSTPAPSSASLKQQEFERVRNAAMAQAQREQAMTNSDPTVSQAMADLEREMGGSPGTSPRSEESLKVEAEEAAAEKVEREYNLLVSRVSPEDAEAYRESVYTLSKFEKSYELFGGNVVVKFSSYGADEDIMIVTQEALDGRLGRVDRMDLPSILMNSARYTFAACLREVKIVKQGVSPVAIPDQMTTAEFLATLPRDAMTEVSGVIAADTNIRLWYRFLATKAIPGSMYRLLFKKFEDFRTTLTAVERLAQYPRFFDPPTQS